MNFKDMLFPIALALLTTWMIQYWFFSDKKTVSQDTQTEFVAPKSKFEMRPLNKEIDFIDEKRPSPAVITEVDTDLAKYVFCSDGASIERLEYKGNFVKQLAGLGTIFPVSDTEMENKFLLLAFNEKTPYFYRFVGRTDNPESIELAYKYESNESDFIVNKTFVIYKNSYKLDLKIDINQKDGVVKSLETRLFFSSPLMVALGKEDVISSVLFDKKGDFKKTVLGSVKDEVGNYNPTLFGSDSKYFIHSMVCDKDGYSQRAYYKIVDGSKLFSILEGPVSNQKQSYNISFYLGPKEENALALVDVRLEKTLEYSGWFSIISKFLLKILKYLNKYLKNYGWSILVLTLIIRLIMLPFTIKADAGTKKRNEFQKKLDYIQKKYANDKETLARERAELIKKHGMPGLSGCLPALVQLPIFFALSNLLRSSIEMYHAPFVFWITDLSAKDPYYILPIMFSGVMLAQAFTVDPKQRFVMIASALVVGPLFASFPAGISLYLVASVGLGVLQTYLVKTFKAA